MTPAVSLEQADLARDLLERAREALRDAAVLASGGSLRGAALRAADATLLGARALLVPRGLDRPEWAAATLLFDRQLIATELVSKACGEAMHRALRARRESDEADIPVFYAARVQSLRDGAGALLAEAEIILERALAAVAPPPAAPKAAPELDEDEF